MTETEYFLFSIQILEKLGMKEEYFPVLKDWMVKAVIPNHKQIMGFGKETAVIADNDKPTNHVHDEKDTEDLLNSIVSKAAENPSEVIEFVY